MTVAETTAKEAGQDFIRDIVRADLLLIGCPSQTAMTG
jgi:hypothetical protein